MQLAKVKQYIDSNILHSEQWDAASEDTKKKAANNAEIILQRLLPDVYDSEVPVDDIAFQAVWMMKIDDSFQRAELGVQQMSVDGVTILFRNKDNTIAPALSQKYGIATVNGIRRRAGRYSVATHDTYRIPVDNSKQLARERR